MKQPTVIVIGAGIVGASCACYLAKAGAKVRVLERAPQAATGATAKSAAGVRHQFSHAANVLMSRYSVEQFRNFEALTGFDAAYRPVGYLFLLEQQSQAWREQLAMQRALGARVERLDPVQVLQRFPYVNVENLCAAHFGMDDGVVDPHAVTLGYLRVAKEYGAELLLNSEVMALQPQANAWQLQVNQDGELQTLQADVVVNAAGAFAGEIGKRAGLDIPVLPYRRNVYATAPLADFPHPTPLIVDVQSGVWLRSEGERFIMGLSNLHEPAGDNQAVDWQWFETLVEHALPRFPFLGQAGLDRKACWAGLYAITPDHAPIIGEMASAPGFVNACGFSGHGVQHSPATGLMVAEEVIEGGIHSFDSSLFRYERFAKGERVLEHNVV